VSSLFLKNMSQELCQILAFRGWRVFLNSPTLDGGLMDSYAHTNEH
jgi:hypothetical protein